MKGKETLKRRNCDGLVIDRELDMGTPTHCYFVLFLLLGASHKIFKKTENRVLQCLYIRQPL